MSDADVAKNKRIVELQKEILTPKEARANEKIKVKNLATYLIRLSEASRPITPEEQDELIESKTKMLRADVLKAGGTIDYLNKARMLNGDIELRAVFTKRIKRCELG